MEETPTSNGKAQALLQQAQALPPQDQAPSTVHRKARRKTSRRKISDSSPSHLWERWQEAQQKAILSLDSLDLLVPLEPVGQTTEEVQFSQSCFFVV